MKKEISKYTLQEIRIEVGDKEFQKALSIYQGNKIKNLKDDIYGYSAQIEGTNTYQVYIHKNAFDRGACDCYLGQQDILCKHMIALAIAVIYKYNPGGLKISNTPVDQAVCSGEIREITENEIKDFKDNIRTALTYLKSYTGPSSKWLQYQNSLIKGSRLILVAISKLPVCEKSVLLCVDVLKRLDKKLLGPVDDSDGTVSSAMYQIIEVLKLFMDLDKDLENFIKQKLPKSEFFDWKSEFGATK